MTSGLIEVFGKKRDFARGFMNNPTYVKGSFYLEASGKRMIQTTGNSEVRATAEDFGKPLLGYSELLSSPPGQQKHTPNYIREMNTTQTALGIRYYERLYGLPPGSPVFRSQAEIAGRRAPTISDKAPLSAWSEYRKAVEGKNFRKWNSSRTPESSYLPLVTLKTLEPVDCSSQLSEARTLEKPFPIHSPCGDRSGTRLGDWNQGYVAKRVNFSPASKQLTGQKREEILAMNVRTLSGLQLPEGWCGDTGNLTDRHLEFSLEPMRLNPPTTSRLDNAVPFPRLGTSTTQRRDEDKPFASHGGTDLCKIPEQIRAKGWLTVLHFEVIGEAVLVCWEDVDEAGDEEKPQTEGTVG
ncbi:hypothetical protein CPC08DRAFT_722246 [Agrocybe pediades]|nr:hypothetical protein CPC08DRAFT_722246 [Agrocybe pediades]